MLFIGFVFPASDRDALLLGEKSAVVIDDVISLKIGVEYPTYIADTDDPFSGPKVTMVGKAVVREISHKRFDDLTAEEISLSAEDRSGNIRKERGRCMFYNPVVTWIRLDISFEWSLVREMLAGPEVRFALTDKDLMTLGSKGQLIDELSVIDTYYDTVDLKLSRKNRWLRHRGDNIGWQMRIPAGGGKWNTIFDEEIIKTKIRVKSLDVTSLIKAGYGAGFATLMSEKKVYRISDYLIETDVTETLNDTQYGIGRISPLIIRNGPLEVSRRLREFCAANGFEPGNPRRKIMEYLRVVKPEVYDSLVDAGVPE